MHAKPTATRVRKSNVRVVSAGRVELAWCDGGGTAHGWEVPHAVRADLAAVWVVDAARRDAVVAGHAYVAAGPSQAERVIAFPYSARVYVAMY